MLQPLLQPVAWLADSLWPPHKEAPASFSLISTKSLAPRQGQLPGGGRCVFFCVYTVCECVWQNSWSRNTACRVCHQSTDVQRITSLWGSSLKKNLFPYHCPPPSITYSHPPTHNFFTRTFSDMDNGFWLMTLIAALPSPPLHLWWHLPSHLTSSSLGCEAEWLRMHRNASCSLGHGSPQSLLPKVH